MENDNFLTDLDLEPVYKFLIYKLFDYVSEENFCY